MRLYEALIGLTSGTEGKIWCTDGSLIRPEFFKNSGREAYGYALDNKRLVRITRSSGMPWTPSMDSLYSIDLEDASSPSDGIKNSEFLKGTGEFNYTNCPAIYYACTQTNGGRTSYMPSRYEVKVLYMSIMCGRMKHDLIKAGLYEKCNYTNSSYLDESNDWLYVWSSSQCSGHPDHVWATNHYGGQGYCLKYSSDGCVVPFFKV